MLGFSLLCASNYYDRKGPVCDVLTFYSKYSHGELPILFLFILLRDTPARVHLLILYFDLYEKYIILIMFYLKSLQNFITYDSCT